MNAIVKQLAELIRRTSSELPEDVQAALAAACKSEAPASRAENILSTIEENTSLAARCSVPLCQDTGTLTFFWRVPRATDTLPLEEACREAVRNATANGWLRQNTIDTLTGASVADNVSDAGAPVIHFEQAAIAAPEVTLLMKGGGSENMSRQYSLPDERLGAGRDWEGVRRCVLDAVFQAQGQGCSPGILGVCVGADRAEGFAVAKQQLLRPLTDASPTPLLANLEARLLVEANSLGIGPMGTGGKTTLLGVKIAARTRLPASYFVTVAYICWACRRRTAVIALENG